jgi:hypothetical protein
MRSKRTIELLLIISLAVFQFLDSSIKGKQKKSNYIYDLTAITHTQITLGAKKRDFRQEEKRSNEESADWYRQILRTFT